MVRPDTALEGVVTALKESGRLPSATTYSVYEIDQDGGQSNLRPPIVEVTTRTVVRSAPHNTDQIGFATDDNGNQIGRIYRSKFEMPVEIDVWTAEGGDYDPHEIGEAVRYALYQYDDQQRGDPLPDPDDPSTSLSEIEKFTMGDGGVRNDLSMTPALRRWRQTGEVWFHETVNTAEEYGSENFVVNVVTPSEDDITTDGDTIEFNSA
jgi:hypothetical protein